MNYVRLRHRCLFLHMGHIKTLVVCVHVTSVFVCVCMELREHPWRLCSGMPSTLFGTECLTSLEAKFT